MAGIGVKLNRIFQKNTLTTNLIGFGYSALITIAPMIFILVALLAMQVLLQVSDTGYTMRELYSCTILYIFIFALLTSAPFNSVLSRYMADVIYNEEFDDIMPCFYIGLAFNVILSAILGIPFCWHEYHAGGVSIMYVLASYTGFMALVLVFYCMLFLSVVKDYKKITLFFAIGMVFTVLLALFLYRVLHQEVTFSMLVGLDAGFLLIAALEYAQIKNYFRTNSGNYRRVFGYFKRFWVLMVTNVFYVMGLYVHNFVFWTTDKRTIVANSFVCMTSYDMAACVGMLTNISATIIFITRVEMFFHSRYKAYSEAVIGGRGIDIEVAKRRMFRQLAEEILNLARIQFIISVIVYFLCVVLLPKFGFGGMMLRIYPCLAAGYFILFLMYGTIIFLYYFNDLKGAMITALSFMASTIAATFVATRLPVIWYGLGLVIGSFIGWTVGYMRLRWMEHNMDEHVFCNGSIMKKGHGGRPADQVYDRRDMA